MSTFRNTKGQYETILPCAKCGSFFVCLYYGNPYNGEPTTVLAHCADCGAEGPRIHGTNDNEALAAWNEERRERVEEQEKQTERAG